MKIYILTLKYLNYKNQNSNISTKKFFLKNIIKHLVNQISRCIFILSLIKKNLLLKKLIHFRKLIIITLK